MIEAAKGIFYENSYPGGTLGAVAMPMGIVLIDSPFRSEDARGWRNALNGLRAGGERLLVILDAHFDRTIGVRGLEAPLLSQDRVVEVIRNRPLNYRAQGSETGADWQLFNLSGSIRWVIPEISFSERFYIHWDEQPVLVESHPGPASGAAWVVIPHQRVAFIGDAVVPDQPPFLAFANLPAWQATLKLLLEPEYEDFTLISGRGGPVTRDQVRQQADFLKTVQEGLQSLASRGKPEDAAGLAEYVARRGPESFSEAKSIQRLRFGLRQLFIRTHRPSMECVEE